MRVAVLGAAHARDGDFPEADEIVVLDPSPAALEQLLADDHDARYTYLLGELPVLPLPDAWVDDVVGVDAAAADDPELRRVRR
jgi:hypothetical protein